MASAALGLEIFDEFVERYVLMRVGPLGNRANALDQFSKGWIAGNVGLKRQ